MKLLVIVHSCIIFSPGTLKLKQSQLSLVTWNTSDSSGLQLGHTIANSWLNKDLMGKIFPHVNLSFRTNNQDTTFYFWFIPSASLTLPSLSTTLSWSHGGGLTGTAHHWYHWSHWVTSIQQWLFGLDDSISRGWYIFIRPSIRYLHHLICAVL